MLKIAIAELHMCKHTHTHLQHMKPVLRKGVYMYISLGRFIYLNYFTVFYLFLNLLLCMYEHVYVMALV